MLGNASSLLATTAVTSLLGFVFWGAAARFFSTASVGAGSAAVSAMTLLGTFGMFGVGTVLIGQLGKVKTNAVGTISAALVLVGVGSTVLGVLGALVLPLVSPSLKPFASGLGGIILFASGVTTTSVGFVLDQALIGLLRGSLQLWRNIIFSFVKLVLLVLAAVALSNRHGVAMYVTWMLGNVVSFVVLAAMVAARGTSLFQQPRWGTIRALRGPVLTHNWLNGAMQAPRLLLPVLVVAVISPTANAAFYAAYLIAGFLYMVPTHLSTVLYAVGAGDRPKLRDQTRFSLALSAAAGALGCAVLGVGAPFVLSLFGHAYASQASNALRILALGVFPTTIKVHFVALCRVTGRITRGGLLMTLGGAFELASAAFGVQVGGLTGLSIALVLAMAVVAVFALSDIRLVTAYSASPASAPSPSPSAAVQIDVGADDAEPPRRDASRSDISVIICAYSERRWDCLVEAVKSLEAQTVSPLEVILVIDYNDSLHERSLRDLPGVRVISNLGERGAGGARNTGVQSARGSIVAFLDDDATAIESWVQIVGERMDASDLLGVGGEVRPRWMAPKPPWFPDEFGWVVGCSYRGLPTAAVPIRNLMAGNMAVVRETFLELGGYRRGHGNVQSDTGSGEARRSRFVTRQSGCEETDFCIRALERFSPRRWLYDPAMQISHQVPAERGRWAYFLARCHDEGLAKATVVVEFSGTAAGLETERAYVSKTLRAGIARGLLVSMRGDIWGVARAGAIAIGLMATGAGYARGRAQTRLRRLLGGPRGDLVESGIGGP